MACRTDALEGMKINRMAEEIELDLEPQESGPSYSSFNWGLVLGDGRVYFIRPRGNSADEVL